MQRSALSNGKSLDLAIEARDLLRGDAQTEIAGVRETVRQHDHATVTTIEIMDEEGAQAMGRPPGHYVTIEAPRFLDEPELAPATGALIAETLREMLPARGEAPWLLAGLGNAAIAADSVGPLVIASSLATRHYFLYMPDSVEEGFTPVALTAPGVLGSTGVESGELLRALAQELKPAAVIVVDALAAGAVARVGTSFQIADTGITPGSGVGNHRLALDRESLGAPVIAIGVPTVVYLETIVDEACAFAREHASGSSVLSAPGDPGADVLRRLAGERGREFAVTPKDIDDLAKSVADAIAIGIQLALHPALTLENVHDYLPH